MNNLNMTLPPRMPRIKNTKPGDIIMAPIGIEEKDNKKLPWVVVQVYPRMVLASHGSRRRCFTYGDLVIMGLEG